MPDPTPDTSTPPPPRARRGRLRRYGPLAAFLAVAAAAWGIALYQFTGLRRPDVPFITTPPDVVAAMVDLAGVRDGDAVYDLGCGDGRLAIAAAGRGPNVHAVGIEIDPDVARQAREAVARAGLEGRVSIRRNDLYREDIGPATVVLAFLMPSVLQNLVPQFDRLAPGSRIVSHQFAIPGHKPRKTIDVRSAEDGMDHRVHLYVAPLER